MSFKIVPHKACIKSFQREQRDTLAPNNSSLNITLPQLKPTQALILFAGM
jgi:hypothetical protein